MSVELAERYFAAVAARDPSAVEPLIHGAFEVATPDGEVIAREAFLGFVRTGPPLDNLDVSFHDRTLELDGNDVVSRSRRVFSWKEDGEVAYEQPALARLLFRDSLVARVVIEQ